MVSSSGGSRDGRQARWDGHKEERRRQIIAAAIDIAQGSEPGAEIHVQEIAERAGLSRTVIYRHFADRSDLDRAVQAEILDQVWVLLLPEITLTGTVPEVIRRVMDTYVTWAVEHPALHRLADHDTVSDHTGPLEAGLDRLAAQIVDLLVLAIPALGVTVDEEMSALLDPMVYGIVGVGFSAVRRWISRPERVLSAERLTDLVTQSIWFVIQGHAATFGFAIAADAQLEDLVGGLAGTGSLPS